MPCPVAFAGVFGFNRDCLQDEMSIARPLLKPKSGVWLQLTPRFPNQHHPNPLAPRPAAAPPRQPPAGVADGWAETVARALPVDRGQRAGGNGRSRQAVAVRAVNRFL